MSPDSISTYDGHQKGFADVAELITDIYKNNSLRLNINIILFKQHFYKYNFSRPLWFVDHLVVMRLINQS